MGAHAAEVIIQRAMPSMAARLSQIATTAKSYWGYPARWIELWRDQLTITPVFIENNEVWAALVDDVILGFYALSGEAPRLQLEHMWVMPVAIRQGIGTAMWQHALERSRMCGATVIEIESDPNAEGFYARMGAQTIGEVSYVMDGQRRALPLLQVQLQAQDAS